MVSYTENIHAINHLLTDEISNAIYNEFELIFMKRGYEKSFDQTALLRKYNDHYLVYYFTAEFYILQKNLDKAVEQYELCLKRNTQCSDVYLSYAITLHKNNKLEQTMDVIVRGLKYHPNSVKLLNFYGVLLYQHKRHKQAYEIFKRIVKNLADPEAYNNFAFSCSAIGKYKKANAYYERGLDLLNSAIERQMSQNKLLNYDYLPKLTDDLFEDYLASNRIFKTVTNVQPIRYQHPKKRIGYVSGDFRNHVVSFFVKPLLQYYDRSKFEVFCFSNLIIPDETTKELQKIPDVGWVEIYNVKPEVVCNWIRQIEIDILIDLSGHTAGNRLDVFALKPAPIQITYLGYPNTTGLTTMDYRLCDQITDPPQTTQKFTEKLVYLPRCFICFAREEKFIPKYDKFDNNERVIFAVTNKEQKYNKYTYRAWNRIINAVPNSLLIVKECDFQQLNLPSNRMMKMDYFLNNQEYLGMYNQIDVCLDTFPYSGTTTTCDTLLTSTPIITLGMPNRHVSNVTNSILTHMGHQELVAHTIDEYIQKAVALGQNKERIMRYKQTLRQEFIELMNPQKFMDDYEQTLDKLSK
jgi:predicted O-linked N-acetylglucosamine transferase (SPINDLY family)